MHVQMHAYFQTFVHAHVYDSLGRGLITEFDTGYGGGGDKLAYQDELCS